MGTDRQTALGHGRVLLVVAADARARAQRAVSDSLNLMLAAARAGAALLPVALPQAAPPPASAPVPALSPTPILVTA